MSIIPYQIDYSVQNTAKTIGFSKKRIVFKFGFANRRVMEGEGTTGAECRGSEHEIVFLWSLKSGKRQLFVNGKEIHYSISHMNGWTNDTSWQHIFTLTDQQQRYRLHFITQPSKTSNNNESNQPIAANRPFDLKVNNLSYFSFNPIYQLGTPRMIAGPPLNQQQNQNRFRSDSPMSPEERQQLAMAKLASLQDIAQQQNTNHSTETPVAKESAPPQQQQQQQDDLLISFDDEDRKDLAAAAAATVPLEQSMTSITGFPTSFITTTTGTNHPYHASSITLDQHFPLNSSSATDVGNNYAMPINEFNRQQPGSYYTNNSTTNPYASTQPSYTGGSTNPYTNSSNNNNPYYNPSTTTSSGTALTPYQPPTAAAVGVVPPQSSSSNPYSQQQYYPPTAGNYYNSNANTNSTYAPLSSSTYAPPPVIPTSQYVPVTTSTNPYNNYDLPSPSATTVFTYGSAPSFAQPPKPPTTTNMSYPQPPTYSNNDFYPSSTTTTSTTNPYGITTPMSLSTASPYGAPITTTSNTSTGMYQPPPQQQPYASTSSSYPY